MRLSCNYEFHHNIVEVVCGSTWLCLVDPQLLWPCYDKIHDQ